jgi:hypothetical protein
MRTIALDRQAAEALDALAAAGIDALLIKGAALARLLYTDDDPRTYRDVDVLADPARWTAARDVLADLGYRCVVSFADMPEPRDDHAEHWERPGSSGTIDLHVRLPGVAVAPERAWAAIAGDTGVVALAGRPVPTLSAVATAMHLALHAGHHGPGEARPLADLERALARLPRGDWHAAAALAAELGAAGRFADGLSLVTGGPELLAELGLGGGPSVELVLKAGARAESARTAAAIASAPSARAAWRIARARLVPSPRFMRHRYRLARRGRAGLALCYAGRPLVLAVTAGPALLAVRRARRKAR